MNEEKVMVLITPTPGGQTPRASKVSKALTLKGGLGFRVVENWFEGHSKQKLNLEPL